MMTLRFGTFLAVMTVALAALGAGCGNSKSSGSGGGNGTGGGGMEQTVNSCSASTAKDETGSSDVTVKFGGTTPGLAYSPACIKIKKGGKVTFAGDFSLHPLAAGSIDASSMMHPDSSSPIKSTSTGMSKTFTFPDSGTFGYFCENHFSVGMDGAVVVE